ncbi:hypothetical protein [Agromyces binzhouensis]|uniref:hypothetical protein n=1 Tax=Agromyces binzhouensis TaxID=1817495 RepID=UPI0013ED9150
MSAPDPSCRNSCSCRNERNGPRTCSSTKYSGSVIAVMRLIIRIGTPKCHARQVTSSPSLIRPVVTPAIARSREADMDAM